MAKPLTQIQKRINKDLKKLNPDFRAFEPKDFDDNVKLIELENHYIKLDKENQKRIEAPDPSFDDYVNMLNDLENSLDRQKPSKMDIEVEEYLKLEKTLKNLMNELAQLPYVESKPIINVSGKELFDATAAFFGLTNQSLIKRIMHEEYVKAVEIQSLDEHEFKMCQTLPVKNLDRWAKFCKSVDQMTEYIKSIYPQWDVMKKSEKLAYITRLEELSHQKFMFDANMLRYFIIFIKNYRLKEKKKFKAQYLLALKLPNIDTIEIAIEVVNNTNLDFFID